MEKSKLLKVVASAVMALAGLLMVVFLALPHFSVIDYVNYSGFNIIANKDQVASSEVLGGGVQIVLVLVLIVAILLIVAAVVKLLCDLEVIKSEKVATIMAWATRAIAAVALILAIVAIILLATKTASLNKDIKELVGANAYKVAWAGPILVAVFGLIGLGASAVKSEN